MRHAPRSGAQPAAAEQLRRSQPALPTPTLLVLLPRAAWPAGPLFPLLCLPAAAPSHRRLLRVSPLLRKCSRCTAAAVERRSDDGPGSTVGVPERGDRTRVAGRSSARLECLERLERRECLERLERRECLERLEVASLAAMFSDVPCQLPQLNCVDVCGLCGRHVARCACARAWARGLVGACPCTCGVGARVKAADERECRACRQKS